MISIGFAADHRCLFHPTSVTTQIVDFISDSIISCIVPPSAALSGVSSYKLQVVNSSGYAHPIDIHDAVDITFIDVPSIISYSPTFIEMSDSKQSFANKQETVVLEVENGASPMGCIFVFDSNHYQNTFISDATTWDAVDWNGTHLECPLPRMERVDIATNISMTVTAGDVAIEAVHAVSFWYLPAPKVDAVYPSVIFDDALSVEETVDLTLFGEHFVQFLDLKCRINGSHIVDAQFVSNRQIRCLDILSLDLSVGDSIAIEVSNNGLDFWGKPDINEKVEYRIVTRIEISALAPTVYYVQSGLDTLQSLKVIGSSFMSSQMELEGDVHIYCVIDGHWSNATVINDSLIHCPLNLALFTANMTVNVYLTAYFMGMDWNRIQRFGAYKLGDTSSLELAFKASPILHSMTTPGMVIDIDAHNITLFGHYLDGLISPDILSIEGTGSLASMEVLLDTLSSPQRATLNPLVAATSVSGIYNLSMHFGEVENVEVCHVVRVCAFCVLSFRFFFG